MGCNPQCTLFWGWAKDEEGLDWLFPYTEEGRTHAEELLNEGLAGVYVDRRGLKYPIPPDNYWDWKYYRGPKPRPSKPEGTHEYEVEYNQVLDKKRELEKELPVALVLGGTSEYHQSGLAIKSSIHTFDWGPSEIDKWKEMATDPNWESVIKHYASFFNMSEPTNLGWFAIGGYW